MGKTPHLPQEKLFQQTLFLGRRLRRLKEICRNKIANS
jgi:hypothetical protein